MRNRTETERCPRCGSDDTRALTWTSQMVSRACECGHRWTRWRYRTDDACNCLIPWLDGAGQHAPNCRAVRCPGCGDDVTREELHECLLTGERVVNPDGLEIL